MKTEIAFVVNGNEVTASVGPRERLLDVLRDTLDLKGTKEGCAEGECGACTVLVEGRAVNACLMPALEIEGKRVTTVEGLLAPNNELSPLQRAFVDRGGIQCGFCSPGMLLSTKALLDQNPDPSDEEIRASLRGNLCRCTGYVQIVASVKEAAARLREARKGGDRDA